ncbi:MAG: preprotein translocase subunit YajC [Planctomycetes bacterium]|nr:preprotein translocase subunit YajC [Planctomycetota bacterium]
MEETSTQGELATTQQDGSNGDQPTNEPGQTPKKGPNMMLWFMLPVLLVYMFFMFRGPKKKQQEHNKMVSSLAKNDRVRTIGGILGTVLDVRDDEIVLKVDESTNTKMRVSPQAIATVLTDKTE